MAIQTCSVLDSGYQTMELSKVLVSIYSFGILHYSLTAKNYIHYVHVFIIRQMWNWQSFILIKYLVSCVLHCKENENTVHLGVE